jgi:hypothetical protein
MKNILRLAAVAILAAAPLAAMASEATFERTLKVSGQANLSIATGAGSIHVTEGAVNQIHILGHVTASNGFWGGKDAEERIKRIVDNPPIEQSGNIIRIGKQKSDAMHNVSISYEIQAPSGALLDASTGSGNLTIDGSFVNPRLATGSGSIHSHGVTGSFNLETGSGNIESDFAGTGDGKVATGSGSIKLHGVQGGLHATTGSGSIDVSGKPLANWKITTGSGSITVDSWKANFTLEASSGSGSITTDVPLTVEGTVSKHHVQGKVNGGGPTVHLSTGSGSIHIR